MERAVENDGAEEIAAQESLPREKPDHLPRLLALIAGTVVASVAFRLAIGMGIQHTSFVFIGIPALLATAVALSGPAETATGTTMRSVTLALLIALTFFGEATICVLMASPIIFLVAGLVVAADKIAARNRRRERRAGFATVPALVLAAAAVPAMEGVVPGFELPREASVTATRVVAATPAEVERALAAPMRFDRRLPAFLRLGFPTPAATHGEGLRVGDRRSVMLEHGHHHSGELVMEVASASPGRARFVPVADQSYITHWLTWRSAEVRWRAAPGGTEVRWTLRYRRRLDPAWYFGPLERYGARAAAGYLVDALATPAGAQP
ncbi:MAG TPA: hypothetical protein VF771_16525 [Longimicrobiaceae bacterium]